MEAKRFYLFTVQLKIKKLITVFAFVATLLLCSTSFIVEVSAMPVQVSDLGAIKLHERLCYTCEKTKMKHNFEKLEHLGQMTPKSPYDTYVTLFGEQGHKSLISFYTNGPGFVSKITVFSNINDKIATKSSGEAFATILYCLGLNFNEIEIVTERLLSEYHSDLWVDRIKRRIIVEAEMDRNQLLTLRITAIDK